MPSGIYKRILIDPVERFISFVEPEPNTGCWLWLGKPNENGYGRFHIGSRKDNSRKTVFAHRFSFEVFVGPIPEGFDILHRCDFTLCVNPEHLFLGTNLENMNDMFSKGRGVKSKKGLPYGVSLAPSGRFVASIKFKMRRFYLGTFDTCEEASSVAIEGKRNKLREENFCGI